MLVSDKWNVVDVWVCNFQSAEAVEEYFDETCGQGDDIPISMFAADIGKRFYDHDFVCREFHEPPAQALEEALERWPHLAWAHPQMLEAFRASPLSPFNLFLVAFGREIERPKSVEIPAAGCTTSADSSTPRPTVLLHDPALERTPAAV